MRGIALAFAACVFAAGPALAQTAVQTPSPTAPTPKHGAAHKAKPHATGAARSSETPLDKGPFTPEANRAYQGGGMVLQGAPGAPPPAPEPTPPGQTPRNMVQ